MGNDMFNDEQLAWARDALGGGMKNDPKVGHPPGTVDEALSWLNRVANGEPGLHYVSLREAVRLVRRKIDAIESERDALLARSAPPETAGTEAVREAAFAKFGRTLLPKWWDDGNPGDIDGGDAQDAAEAAGLWHPVERHADGVECESCGNEGPCGELTEAGLSALAARGGA